MTPGESLAHDMLEAGNARFQIAAHPNRVLFWSADALGACEVVSTNWTACTGQAFENALGLGWLDAVHGEDRILVTDTVRAAIETHRGFYLHYRLRRADGSARRVLHVAAARALPSGKFNGLVGTLTDETDTEAGENSLQHSEEQVFEFLEGVGLAAVAIDMEGRLVHINQVMARQIGQAAESLLGCNWIGDYVSSEDRPRLAALFAADAPPSALPHELEYQVETVKGQCLFRWHLTLIRDPGGAPMSIAMMGSDITEWRRMGDRMRLNAQVFDSSNEAMVITDRQNNIISVNRAFTLLTGYERDEALGKNPRILSSGRQDAAFYRSMWESIIENGYWRGDIWDRRKDGSCYPKFLSITAIRDDAGQIAKFSAVFYDVSERKEMEAQLENLAHYDSLTGLPNRMLLHDRLEQAIATAERQRQHFALLFIDLDGFKPVNDDHGHGVGDEVLKLVGQRLNLIIRGMDTAARLGGDEFVVILTDIRNRENTERVAEKIISELSEPFQVAGKTLSISASIGASLYPSDQKVALDLLRTADEAMYQAKRDGKRRVKFYGGFA
ncbi:MAG: diguanylate cyclase [Sulfuritalea sp.]|nr:diguanylate cyclase [Sulfuritalea sp.]